MIRRREIKSRVGIIDFLEFEHEKVSYCKNCIKFGFYIVLTNRVYPDNEPIPLDHENWLQCHECGSIVPIYEKKIEPIIKDVVETSDNPFDIAKDQLLGIESRTSINNNKRNARKKRQKKLDAIQESDIKTEINKGNQVTIHQWQ